MPDFVPDSSKINKIHDSASRLITFVMTIFTFALCIFTVFDQSGIINISALFPLPFMIQLLLLLIILYGICCLTISCTIVLWFILLYGYYVVLFYSNELHLNRDRYRTESRLRKDPKTLRQVYRAFQVLHQNALYLFGPYIIAANAAFMVSMIYLNFVLIRYWTQMSIQTKAPLVMGEFLDFSIWTGVIVMGIFLSSKGSKVLNSWNGNKWSSPIENETMKRFRRSCKPLVLCYGTQFVVGKSSLFVFYRSVIRGTCRALLTTRHKFHTIYY